MDHRSGKLILKNEEVKLAVKETLKEINKLSILTWDLLETTLSKIKEEYTEYTKNVRHKPWMISEILGLMEAQLQHKPTDTKKYIETNAVIRRKIREAEEMWLSEK